MSCSWHRTENWEALTFTEGKSILIYCLKHILEEKLSPSSKNSVTHHCAISSFLGEKSASTNAKLSLCK